MNIILREWKRYKLLSRKARLLIKSFALHTIASPLLSLFTNAFIWRDTSSFLYIAVYNLGLFVFLPIGFYVNGLLLKRIKITVLYLIGLLIAMLAVLAVVFFSGSNIWHFIIYGCIFGFGNGLYWGNRHFLVFQGTESKQRNYFFGINTSLSSLISLCITFLAGWFIVFGEHSILYNPTIAYWILSIVALAATIASGAVILKADYKSPRVNGMVQFNISKKWNRIRFINLSMGISEGLHFFLPALLILFYLGKEGVLGTISTIVALLAIVVTYLYGRFSKGEDRRPTFFVSSIIYILISFFLLILGEPLGVLIFALLNGITIKFQWLAIEPFSLDVMDKEIEKKKDNEYTLVFDREMFLNIGRIIGVLILFFIIYLTSQEKAFFLTPLILGIVQLILMLFIWRRKSS